MFLSFIELCVLQLLVCRVEVGIAEQEVLRNTHEILGFLDLLDNQRYIPHSAHAT